jgi:hypothetical protein
MQPAAANITQQAAEKSRSKPIAFYPRVSVWQHRGSGRRRIIGANHILDDQFGGIEAGIELFIGRLRLRRVPMSMRIAGRIYQAQNDYMVTYT